MALTRELIQTLEETAVKEVAGNLSWEKCGFLNEDEGLSIKTITGWLAFIMELRKGSCLDDGLKINEQVDLEEELNALREEHLHDERLAARWDLEEVILCARIKAIQVLNGDIEPHNVFRRMMSLSGFPSITKVYMAVDWTGDWSRPEISEPPYESYKRSGGSGSD